MLAALAAKLTGEGQRLLVVADDQALLASLDRQLWTETPPSSFLAHGKEGGSDDKRQPVLLSTRTVAPNQARNIALVDGEWRAAALNFDRAFFLFDGATIEAARGAWKSLKTEEGVERHYWAQEDGRWVEKA